MPPDEQGFEPQDGGGTGIFDSYLQAVPEDGREVVMAYLKDAEKHVNEQVQTAAEYRKQYEPYAGLDLPEPQELSELIEFKNGVLSSQEAFDQWVGQQAQEKGWTKAEVEQQFAEEQQFDENKIQELIDQRAQQLLSPLEERQEEVEFAQGVEFETDAINREIGRLESDAKVSLNQEQRATVFRLGEAYARDNRGQELPVGDVSWVEKGWQDYRRLGADFNRSFIEEASSQPAAAMTTGGQAKYKPVTTFQEAGEALRERMKQAQT